MKKLLITLFIFSLITFQNVFSYSTLDLDHVQTVNYQSSYGISIAFDFDISDDGTKLFLGRSDIFEITLSTPWDISSGTTTSNVLDLSPLTSDTRAIEFENGGLHLYIMDDSTRTIYRYDLASPYDITSAVDSGQSFSANSSANGFKIVDNGNKVMTIDYSSDQIKLYDLSIPYNINNATFNSSFSINYSANTAEFNDDGDKLFIADDGNRRIYEYTLSNNFDLTNVTEVNNVSLVNEIPNGFWGLEFGDQGTIMYALDFSSDVIAQYDTNIVTEPPEYTVQLATNYAPYANFIYTDDEVLIQTDSIDKTILNNEPWSIQTNISDTGPFTFNEWFDLDNLTTFDTNRTFSIGDPDRNYNLIANYTLDQSVNLSFDSNHPSPQNFDLVVETLEGLDGVINQYPFNNHEHPLDFNWEIEAPTTNIGFYEFDYWFDNNTNEIYSFNSLITGSGINNKDLTATYSLPEEYQINLTISTNIGFITFQLGNQTPITGSTINTIISAGDDWSAFVPNETNDFIFREWYDFNQFESFTTNNQLDVTNTNNDYYLEAQYNPLYDVNWDSDGGTPIPSQKIEIANFINEPNPPSKPNFAFGGWYEEGDVTQTEINFPYQVTEDITFVAIWLDTYTLTFDVNGGQKIDSITYIASETPEVVTPSRFGYEFTGWFTDDGTFQNAYDFTDPITQDTTIHARWAFGSDRNAQLSLTTFLDDNDLGDGFSQIVIMISIYIFVNIIIFIYQAPLIVTLILNFIVTSLFMILGWIAIWIVVVIFMSLFGLLYFFSSGRGITE